MLTSALAALALTASQAASAQDGGSQLIVHHQGAGTLDQSGWTDAQSQDGGFSGRFPCLYDDYSQTVPEQPDLKIHWLNCLRADGVRFAMMRSVGLAPEAAKVRFDATADDKKFNPVTVKGMSGYSYATIADGRCARVTLVWTGQDTIMAIAERMGGEANCLGILADANKFVDSLEVER